MIDYHIHTQHSIDAEGGIDEYCRRAVEIGLKEICFTNHCELDPERDDSLIRFDGKNRPLTRDGLLRLQDEVFDARERYKNRGLSIKFGLEVGYYKGIEPRLKELLKDIQFDFILGAIHCLDHICIDSSREHPLYFGHHSAEELLENYFIALEDLVQCPYFNSVAHFDVYKKYGLGYYGAEIRNFPETKMRNVIKLMKENGLAMEINTAGLRRVDEFYPGPRILEVAYDEGLEMITLGSDAHRPEDLGRNIEEAVEYVRSFGFKRVFRFHQRKPIPLEI